jgi:GT2 family glycosyltransferase
MQSSPIQTSVIIPVFNQWDYTSKCLRSLKAHTPENIQVIVVDNASTDQTQTELDALGASLWGNSFHAIHCDINHGFACACNLGAKAATAQTLFFLNNDTELTPNWLPPLLEALNADKSLGAVGPLLLYPGSNLVQHLGIAFLPGAQAEHLYEYFPAGHPLIAGQRYPKAMTAAALCMRRETFLDAGGFFEGYRNGCEDIDLCLTLGEQGRRFRCVPESVVYHYTSQTAGRFDNDQPNSALLLSRHERNLTPDIHLHALQDGYDIRLNEWLLITVCMAAQRASELSVLAGGRGPQQWFEMLEREPLWAEGYDLLADWFDSKESFQESLHIRTLAAHFHPSKARYIRLIKTAQKCRTPDMARHAREKLEKIAMESADLRRRAIRRVQWAKSEREPFWEKLYMDWLTHHDAKACR